ncbi:MAG: SixA phosphatase family protein [Gammaproteobacteria bacterium]
MDAYYSPMRHLTLVRHAKSSWRFGGLEDARRPLNRRGLNDCLSMPARMAACVPAPDAILASDAVRTVQTAVAIAAAYDLPEDAVHLDSSLYLAGDLDMLAVCAERRWREYEHLMLVGHNPGMTELYNRLVAQALDNMPTFAVAHLECGCTWNELAGCGENEAPVRLSTYVTPKS